MQALAGRGIGEPGLPALDGVARRARALGDRIGGCPAIGEGGDRREVASAHEGRLALQGLLVPGLCVQDLLADSGRDDPGRDDGRCFHAQADAAEGKTSAGGAGAQERAERCGQRCGGQTLEGGALGAAAALEGCAVFALAQMRAEPPPLGGGEPAFVQLRERDLRLLAGEASLELLAKCAARTEEQSLDSGE